MNLRLVKFLIAISSEINFDMHGDNCSIPGCSTSRAIPGVVLLGIPKNDDEFNMNWRKNVADMIIKMRVVDANSKK